MVDIRRHLAVLALGVGGLVGWQVAPATPAAPTGTTLESADERARPALAIRAITVAPSGAWITRGMRAETLAPLLDGEVERVPGLSLSELPGSAGRLWVHGLPPSLDPDSLRVGGTHFDDSTGLRIEREPGEETARYRELSEALAEARGDGRAIRVALEENAVKREIAREQLGALNADGDMAQLWAEDGPVAELMGRLTEARRELLERRARNEERQRELRERLDEAAGQGGWKLGIPLLPSPVEAGGEAAAVRLEYRVGQAGWEPIYTARLDTVEDRVDWRMTARVHQQSGEDWPAASMTLVTSDRRRFYPVPSLEPVTIGFVDPDRGGPVRPMAEMVAPALAGSRSAAAEAGDTTGYASQIAINRPARVPSGAGGVRLEVFDQTHDAEVELRLAPQQSLDAVLVGRFEPSVAQPLPPGRWEVHRDGQQQAGVSRLAVAPGEPVELSFGVDPRIAVDFRRIPDERAGHGLIGKFKQVERRRRLEVTSHHDRSVPMTVLMRLPKALDADIVVEPLAEMASPAVRDLDGRAGVWAYRRDLAPGDPWQIDFAYRVRWPEGKTISPF